jgi:peroxiredoxin
MPKLGFALGAIVAFVFHASFFTPSYADLDASQAPIEARDLLTGQARAFKPDATRKGTVLVFLSARCPCSASHEAKLRSAVAHFGAPDFQFVGVHSTADEPLAEAKEVFARRSLPLPILQDAGSVIANRFGALKTPHVFILSPQGRILYDGGVDDSREASRSTQDYLHEALSSIQAGQAVPRPRTRALGCVIARQ